MIAVPDVEVVVLAVAEATKIAAVDSYVALNELVYLSFRHHRRTCGSLSHGREGTAYGISENPGTETREQT